MSNAKISIEKLTATYIKIRDKRSKLATEFKTKDDELKSQQDRIKRALLEHCKEHDVESVRTAEGLFYRTIKKRFWTNDWESMHKFILDQQVPEFLDKRLNQSHVKQFLEDNPDLLPPGLNVDSEYAIAVRKK
tara:strand:+ start:7156 stop:7554 length:399 start_codon:yes stop_codon:yes gene_type:complete